MGDLREDVRCADNVSRRDFLKTGAVAAAVLSPAVSAGAQAAGAQINDRVAQADPPNAAAARIRRIAIEEAFLTEEIADEWKKVLASKFVEPGFALMGDTILGDNPFAKVLHGRLIDIGAGRIAQMDATGIDMEVLSMTAPGVQVFDAITGASLARDSNDQLAQAIRRYPTRFAGLAAIAPQNPQSAAREMERAVRNLGMKGTIINSHTMGEYLDDQKFWIIFEAAQALDAPIYLHPREPAPSLVQPFLDYGLYFAGWGFAAECGLHAMRIIMCGVLDRFPKVKIILGHMGEGIPYYLKRIDNRYLLQVKIGAVTKLPKLPSEYFKDNFVITTSGMTDLGVMRLAHEALGADRILFAADYPYEVVEEEVAFMDTVPLPAGDRRKIYERNAVKLLKL